MSASDAWESTQFVPGAAAMTGFIAVCRNKQIDAEALNEVERAVAELVKGAEIHGSDPSSLMAMLRSVAGDSDNRIDLATRREAYRIGGLVWGVRGKTSFSTDFFHPGSDPAKVHTLALTGELGVERLRPGATVVLFTQGHTETQGTTKYHPRWESLEPLPESSRELEPMLSRFSTGSALRAKRLPDFAGHARIEFGPDTIGATGAANYVSGQLFRDVGRRWGVVDHCLLWATLAARMPVRTLQHDLLVHRDLWPGVTVKEHLYSALQGEHFDSKSRQDSDILPVRIETASELDPVSEAETPDIPRYNSMLEWACARVGWRLEEFRLYRAKVTFPVIPSTLVRTVRLPMQP